VHGHSISPGVDIQQWKPWLPPKQEDTKRWVRYNPGLSLSKAIQGFRLERCKVVPSAVWYGGSKRTGSDTLMASCDHAHAYSLFRANPDIHNFAFGRILFIFELQLQAIVAKVRQYLLSTTLHTYTHTHTHTHTHAQI